MRQNLLLVACVCSCLAVISAGPVPAGGDRELDVLQIPLPNGKELDVLTIGTKDQEQAIAERNKRTIGLLRELFPEITQQIDSIVNRIIAQIIRVVGPDVFRSVLSQNRPSTEKSSVSFDDDDDDDVDDNEDDSDDNDSNGNTNNKREFDTKQTSQNDLASIGTTSRNSSNSDEAGTRITLDLPTLSPVGKENR